MMFLLELWSKNFYERKNKSFFLKYHCSDEHELDECKVDDATKKILLNNIRRRLTPQAVKCRAGRKENKFSLIILLFDWYLDVEVACYGYEGVDAVKAALREGLNASTEEMPVKVRNHSIRWVRKDKRCVDLD